MPHPPSNYRLVGYFTFHVARLQLFFLGVTAIRAGVTGFKIDFSAVVADIVPVFGIGYAAANLFQFFSHFFRLLFMTQFF
jgi:hypothetical protein